MQDTPTDSYGVAAGELKAFIERVERLEEEKKDISEQIKEVMAEAKGRGYDTKILRKEAFEKHRVGSPEDGPSRSAEEEAGHDPSQDDWL